MTDDIHINIKPLAWEDLVSARGVLREAKVKVFYDASYLIIKWSDGKYKVAISYPGYQVAFDGPRFYGSAKEAKDAAQADYERRIRESMKGGEV